MKEGTFIRSFKAKDNREVTLRAPRWSDLDEMLAFVNSLVEEGAEIGTNKKISRHDQIDWLAKHLIDVEKDEKIAIVAEVEGRFVGQLEVRFSRDSSRHVGSLIISILDKYRDLGIGTEMMKEAEIQSRLQGLNILTLETFASNERALHLYRKIGYNIVGIIPRGFQRDSSYIDKIIMMIELYKENS